MEQLKFLEFLTVAEKLKCNTRHSFTTSGRKESVAEHSWRLALMAMLCRDEFPHLDMDKVIKMCLIHDLGEAVTGDVPAFYKTEAHRRTEDKAVETLLAGLPAPHREEFAALFAEMEARETEEAKLWKALDNLEAVISHNEAALSTWIPLEYTENLVYGESNCAFSPWTAALREMLKQDSIEKIEREQ